MKDFEHLKKQGRIEKVSVDKAKAKGLINRSETRLKNQGEREINERNAFEVLENTYESVREIAEAGMAAEGCKANDHVSVIAYAKEKLALTRAEANKFHRFRRLRNESRYEAKKITEEEARQIIRFAEELVPKMREKIKEKI